MMELDPELRTHIVVNVTGARRLLSEIIDWAHQPDTVGKFSIRHREPDDATIYFTDNDTALTCLLLFGEVPRSTSSEMGMYPYAVAYRGSRAVQTIAELRDWLNELPERSWSLETEKMISPDTFVVKNVIVIRFASRDEAFSFKLRWHAAI